MSDNPKKDVPSYALEELKLYIDAYKHHFEIFIKGALIYFGIIGAITSYLFRARMNDPSRYSLAVFIIVISLITVIGCATSLRWLRSTEQRSLALQKQLRMAAFSFDGAKWVGRLMLVAALVFSGWWFCGGLGDQNRKTNCDQQPDSGDSERRAEHGSLSA